MEYKLIVQYTCPDCKTAGQEEFDGYDICIYTDIPSCDCCGPVHELELSVTCSGCKKRHYIKLR